MSDNYGLKIVDVVHSWRITTVSTDGRHLSMYGEDDAGAQLFAELLDTAPKRRGLQWAGLFLRDGGPTGQWACIAQHTRPTV